MAKKNILNLSFDELERELSDKIDFKYRTSQIFHSLHDKLIFDFRKFLNVPEKIRNYLEENFEFPYFRNITVSDSKDNTKKFLFEITDKSSRKSDKFRIETVLIPEGERKTICVSTQVGCNVGCEFCATGKMGLLKNLDVSEILLQVYNVILITAEKPTNLVFMGMGEPFLNYENLISALKILTDTRGLAIPSRRITVSSVGLKGRIKKFADDLVKNENSSIKNIKFALSLHSTNQGIRDSIIPISRTNKLSVLYEELIYFYRKTKNKITYEYIFFPGINDEDDDISRLIKLSRMLPCNINIIPFHPIGFNMKPPLDMLKYPEGKHNSLLINKLNYFINRLKSKKVVINLRTSSGVDINAACGQLATKYQNL